MDPGSEGVVFPKVGAEKKLVRDVENFDDLVQNGQALLVFKLTHVLLNNCAKYATTLLHNVKYRRSLLIKLILVLLGKTEESDAACKDTLVVARLQSVCNVVKECRPFFGVVKSANRNNASDELFVDGAIVALKHLGNDVGAHVALVIWIQDNVAESCYRDLFCLLETMILPVVLDALTEKHCGGQADIWTT